VTRAAADTAVLFSAAEMRRRRAALEAVMTEHGVGHAVLYGANRSGSAVFWLTGWPVTREAHVLVTPGEPDVLLVNFANHVPAAARAAGRADPEADVRWAGPRPVDTLLDLLAHRAGRGGAIGVVGPLPYQQHAALAAVGGRLVNLDAGYTRLRLRKSAEEVGALRRAAELTDLAARTLLDEPAEGRTEHELVARIEHRYVSRGGMHHIHYLMVTAMAEPDRCVPAQWPSDRRVAAGDLLCFELSAAVAPEYAGQLLRSWTVAAEPSALVRDLHAVAEAAVDAITAKLRPGVLPAELAEAAGVVEDAGFGTVDDLVHGFGGGYLPPVVASRGRPGAQPPPLPLEAGMTVVVQPNVVSADGRIGVQTGELLLVTDSGPQPLHDFPRGLRRIA
jgi:Xaa-Pro aminopeptidase